MSKTKLIVMTLFVCLFLGPRPAWSRFVPAPVDGVEGEYLVVLCEDTGKVREVAKELLGGRLDRVRRVWKHALHGFEAEMDEASARALSRDPRVCSVYQDVGISVPVNDCYGGMSLADPAPEPFSPQSLDCADPDPQNPDGVCVDNWGLDRVDQREWYRDGHYRFRAMGSGVHVYLVDTGLFAGHDEFRLPDGSSRAYGGINVENPLQPTATGDCTNWGHGTHVAGIVGGKRYGVAKDVWLHPVKVWDCAGSLEISTLVSAYNWIAGHHDPASDGPAVINMSINGPGAFVDPEAPLSVAIRNVVSRGMLVSHSAGNHKADACSWSAHDSGALVVGGVDELDTLWERTPGDPYYNLYCSPDCGSNNGACVDLWAPSAHIISAWYTSAAHPTGFCRLSGTSMAAPHVAGAAALYLENHPGASPAQVSQELFETATKDVLDDSIGDAPNRLLCTTCIDCQDADSDGFTAGVCGGPDCDDTDPEVHPGADEIPCDRRDNDCNFDTPDDSDPSDEDRDGYSRGCDGDCDDTNPAVHPGASEILCDTHDNDCNPATPEDTNPVDADQDGYSLGCGADCDDTVPEVHPGAGEIACDRLDNDCDPDTPDDSDPTDVDQDGYSLGCGADCDDLHHGVHPGAVEIACDGDNNDCNPRTPDDSDTTDADGDGYTQGCGQDCDDDNAKINPGADELCDDQVDNDCDGKVDEDCGSLGCGCSASNSIGGKAGWSLVLLSFFCLVTKPGARRRFLRHLRTTDA